MAIRIRQAKDAPPAKSSKPKPTAIQSGQVMFDLTLDKTFIVLCSCAKSFPREHTTRYVREHPERFRAATDTERRQLHAPAKSSTIQQTATT